MHMSRSGDDGEGGAYLVRLPVLPDCAQRWGRARHTRRPGGAPTERRRGGRHAGRGGGGKQTGACIPTPLHPRLHANMRANGGGR